MGFTVLSNVLQGDKNAVRQYIEVMHETCPEKRRVAYIASAYVILSNILRSTSTISEVAEITVNLRNILDTINEVVLIEKSTIEALVRGFITWKLGITSTLTSPVNATNNFYEIIGLDQVLSQDDLTLIDSKIDLFNKVYHIAEAALGKHIESVYKGGK